MSHPTPHPVKALLAARRVSIKALARRLDVSAHYLGRVINGYAKPSARLVGGLAALLGAPAEELFHPLEAGSRHPGDTQLGGAA